MDERLLSGESGYEDADLEYSLRPQTLRQYIGQDKVKENLEVFIEAAKMREETLDHVLLYGPPGLGKTTLANIIANEMGVNIRTTSGPAIERPGDLAAILTALEPGDVLFIDEIHRLPRSIEEVLYPAMEDFCLDIVIGKGPDSSFGTARLTSIYASWGHDKGRFALSAPLSDRFGVLSRLEYYTVDQLTGYRRYVQQKFWKRKWIRSAAVRNCKKVTGYTPELQIVYYDGYGISPKYVEMGRLRWNLHNYALRIIASRPIRTRSY